MPDYPDGVIPATVIGSVTVVGVVTISGTVTVTGAVTVSGTVAISGTVTVTGAVTVSGTVAISGTVTVSGAVTVTGSVTVSGTVAISGTVTVSGAVTVTGSVTVSGTVAISGTVTVSGAVTVTGTVSISGTVTVTGAVTVTGSVTVSGTVAISGTVTVSGTVAISGTVTVSGTVAISGTVTVSGAVTVTGTVSISGTVTVSGAVTVTGAVTVSGTVAISGTVTISGSVRITGTVTISGAVTITSGAVTITTVGGTNIIIDQLVQGAVTSRLFELANDNGVAAPTAPPSNTTGEVYAGKFFPRGCRGWMEYLAIYSKRTGAGTITLSYAPQPGIGAVGSVVITPAAGWTWAYLLPNRFWNYDSLFVWISACSADVSWAYQGATPYDYLTSGDAGVSWHPDSYRIYVRAGIKLATVGDLPVSGTVNNVPIPSSGSNLIYSSVAVAAGTEVTVQTFAGAGKLLMAALYVDAAAGSESTFFKIYSDGILAARCSPACLTLDGIGATTPGWQLTKYAVNGRNVIYVQIPIEFRRQLKITATAPAGQAQTAGAESTVNLIQ